MSLICGTIGAIDAWGMGADRMATQNGVGGRLAFLKFDDGTRQLLREFRAILAPRIDGILDRFYGHVKQTPEVARLFKDDASMRHAREMQRRHWLDNIFSGEFGEA